MRIIYVVILVLLALPLRAQELPLMTQEQLMRVYLDSLRAWQLVEEGQSELEAALNESEKASEKLRQDLQESEEAQQRLQQDIESAWKQHDDLAESFKNYKTEAKTKQEAAFGALYREIDKYQMGLFGLAGGIVGGLIGYVISDKMGALAGSGIGVGTGIVISLIF